MYTDNTPPISVHEDSKYFSYAGTAFNITKLFSGDLRDDHNPDFLREYHRALSVVCSDLFFARFRRSTKPRSEDNVQGALQLLQSMFGECHTEDEKVKMVDDLLDVKLLPATNVEGVHFNTERLRER